jgi:hypothetical protein
MTRQLQITHFRHTFFAIGTALAILIGGSSNVLAGGASAATAAPAAVSVASANAQSVSIDSNEGGGGACTGPQIECDRWLQEQHKKILLKLMATYYTLGTGQKGNATQQAEIIANLVANVIAVKL